MVDVTARDGRSHRVIRQEIFDAVFATIDRARDFVVLDFFLVNDDRGAMAAEVSPHRALSSELVDRLVARKKAVPGLRVLFVTDPINDMYGGAPATGLARLRAAGIDVVVTRIAALRDPNPLYSGLHRLLVGWWRGDGRGRGWLPNPLDEGPERVTLRSWLRLIDFKANHRKLIAADDGAGGLVAIVTSANPHDASSAHSNVGLLVRGPLVRDIVESELAIAKFSGWSASWSLPSAKSPVAPGGPIQAQYLTEAAIADATLAVIAETEAGDSIDLAVFYLAERRHIEALAAAARRGVAVRIVLDPNKDAFGHTKDGVPNRPVAAELRRLGGERLQVRWYETRGEQFHAKLIAVRGREDFWLCLGSANLTRRNLDDYNLEANLALTAPVDGSLSREVRRWFDTLWHDDPAEGLAYTTAYSAYADRSWLRYWRYRIMEATGLSTF
ncbi:MAG: phospholipase D-like domain-containing protein [Myxococcota bacterium]